MPLMWVAHKTRETGRATNFLEGATAKRVIHRARALGAHRGVHLLYVVVVVVVGITNSNPSERRIRLCGDVLSLSQSVAFFLYRLLSVSYRSYIELLDRARLYTPSGSLSLSVWVCVRARVCVTFF